MTRASGIFASPWFHRRHSLTSDGQSATETEVAEWARAPYDELIENLSLRAGDDGRAPGTVMLTAARHGDGTTTTALLLGACLASSGRCLVVDLNFRRPGLARAIDLPDLVEPPGGAFGSDGGALEQVVETEIRDLLALPLPPDVGVRNGHGRSLPDARAVRATLGRLSQEFRHVVIDAAPVLGCPETSRFAGAADGTILVIAADETPLEACVAARQALERGSTPVLGAVLTRQRRFVPEFLARRLGQV